MFDNIECTKVDLGPEPLKIKSIKLNTCLDKNKKLNDLIEVSKTIDELYFLLDID